MIAAALSYGLAAASVAGIGYLAVALWQTLAFGWRRGRECEPDSPPLQSPPQGLPAVTILKPLRGDEPGLYENLSSFCDQRYESYQIVFGVRDEHDPAAEVARRVGVSPATLYRYIPGGRSGLRRGDIIGAYD